MFRVQDGICTLVFVSFQSVQSTRFKNSSPLTIVTGELMKLIQTSVLLMLVFLPLSTAHHYSSDYGGYSSVTSSVRESEWARVRESEYARMPVYNNYGYGFYGNQFSEFSRSREFDFGRSYEASYSSRMSGYPYGSYMPARQYNNYDNWGYSPLRGYTSTHSGTMPYGYGYYNWY